MVAVLSRLVLVAVAIALFVQWRLYSQNVSPVSVFFPPLPIFPAEDSRLTGKVEFIGVDDLIGPESLVSTRIKGGRNVMFATLGDGRIVRIEENRDKDGGGDGDLSWTTLIRTGTISPQDAELCGKGGPSDSTNTESLCGRPLGIKIVKRSTVDPNEPGNDEDVLVIADAYKGLLMVSGIYGDDTTAQRHVLSTRAITDPDNYSFQLLNALVQTPDGTLYITETSQQFQRRRIFHAVLDGKPTGRLLKYTKGKGVEVVVDGLYMPNGIALSHDKEYLIIVAGVQVLRFSLINQTMESDPFIFSMYGTGDNIDAMNHLPTGERRKCYWAGYGSKYAQPFSLLKMVADKPMVKALVAALVPYKTLVNLIPKFSALAVYGENGDLIDIFQDVNATAPWLSEGEAMGEYLYLGSWYNNFLARVKVGEL